LNLTAATAVLVPAATESSAVLTSVLSTCVFAYVTAKSVFSVYVDVISIQVTADAAPVVVRVEIVFSSTPPTVDSIVTIISVS
jgi:hypothetical protein